MVVLDIGKRGFGKNREVSVLVKNGGLGARLVFLRRSAINGGSGVGLVNLSVNDGVCNFISRIWGKNGEDMVFQIINNGSRVRLGILYRLP